MSSIQLPMPHPSDVASLVESLANKAAEGRPLLATDLLRESLDGALVTGNVFVDALAIDNTLSQPADMDEDGVGGGLNYIVVVMQRACTRRGSTELTKEQESIYRYAHLLQKYWIGGNLKFLKLDHREEWGETEQRLRRLNKPLDEGLETPAQILTALNLGWCLERLQAVHKTYGRVLGLGELTDDLAKHAAAWNEALNNFLSGVNFHHAKDPKIQELFIAPYEAALEAGRERRREAAEKRTAKKNDEAI